MKEREGNWLWEWMPFFYDQFYKRFPPYQRLHQEIIENLKSSSLPAEYILDAGCGTGLLSLKLAQLGYPVIGIDQSTRMLKMAEKKRKGGRPENLLFLEGDLNTGIKLEGYSFSKIILIHSLYLVEDPISTLQNLSSFLRRGGEVILCNPSRSLSNRELWAGGLFFLREVTRESGFFAFIAFLLISLGMGVLNIIIQRQKQKKVFHCWHEKEITHLLETSGLKMKWLKESCLGNSHLLACAIKE